MNELKQKVADIARKFLRIETLEARNSDSLDFHDVGVLDLEAALLEAHRQGYAAALADERAERRRK